MDGGRDRGHAVGAAPAAAEEAAPPVLPAQEAGPRGASGPVRGARAGEPAGGRRLPARLDPWLLGGAFLAVYAALSLSRYRHLDTMSWDLGIYEQAVKGYAHLHAPVADLKGPGFNELGDHFSPVIALAAPAYRLFPTPVTLLTVQALLFALSTVPVARGAALLLGRARGLAVGAAYGLSWGVQRAVDFDFHEIAFAMPLLAFSLEAVARRRWAAAMWWALPLVLVKEDMGAAVAMIGVAVWLRAGRRTVRGRRARTWAVRLALFGIAASVVEVCWLIPAMHGPGYDALNHINGDGSLTGHVPPVTALRTVLWVLLPAGGLLALGSPLLLAALPTFGWRFVSHYPENWGTAWHYSAVLMPVVFLAAVDCAAAVRTAGPRNRWAPSWLRSAARAMPAAALGAALALSAQLPVAALTHRAAYRVDPQNRAAERALGRIPDGATVEANVGPISRLVHRTTVYWVGQTGTLAPDYLAFENRSGWLQDPAGYALELHPQARYSVVADAGGYVVLGRLQPPRALRAG
jgi:uncharacterized membrane protein